MTDAVLYIGLSICALLWCWVMTQDTARQNQNDQRDAEIKQMERENDGQRAKKPANPQG